MHGGRWLLNPRATLASAGVRAGATLSLTLRAFRGGGGDGGATGAESRSAYLEMYADGGGKGFSTKRETLGGFVRYSTQSTVRDRDEREEELARWFNCAFTEQPLETGDGAVVMDRLGRLYNKEGVLNALMLKATEGMKLPQRLEHVTGMKALLTLKLHRNAGLGDKEKKKESVNAANCRLDAEAKFSCPVSGLDFNGKTKFFALSPSGLVVSERALRDAKDAVADMLGEGVKLEEQTRIPVNPKGEEAEKLKEALDEEAAKKAAKKRKKDAKKNGGVEGSPDENKEVELIPGTGIKSSTKREWNGCDELGNEQLKAQAKRWRAADHAPDGDEISKQAYASLFTGTNAESREKETFLSRNARRGW